MKIIYLVHQFFPEYQTGTERFVLNTAMMAQQFGNKVKVITHSSYDDSSYENKTSGILYKEFIYDGIPVIAFKYQQHPPNINLGLHNNLLYGFAHAVLEFESPDLIHVGHPMRVHEFLWAAQDLQFPYIITLTDFFLLCPKVNLTPDNFSLCIGPKHGAACAELCQELNPPFISERLSDAGRILTNARQVICPSKFVASIYQYEFPDLKIFIIPHGIRYKHIKKNNRLYTKGDEIIYGYIGNLIYHKGVHILLSAFKEMAHQKAKLKIFGFGRDEFVQKLKEIVNNDHRVTFEGSFEAEQLGDVFGQIDVLVTPSLCYETYSFTLHEALACNVPVIASNLGVMGEKIQDCRNGFKFNPGDSSNLKEKMEAIIDTPALLNTMKKNIKMDIIVPTIEQEAYKYFQIYKNTMEHI